MRTPVTFPRITRSWRSGSGRPAIARPPSSPRSRSPGDSGSRADSTSTTTSCRRGAPNARPARRRTAPSRICARSRSSLFFSGFTTTTRTLPTPLPSPSAAVTPRNPYLGEVAAMDEQLGRLVAGIRAAERSKGPAAIVIVGDHGEGLGEHGESQHGNLLYQATMHVPLLLVGPGVAARRRATRRSARGGSFTRSWTGRVSKTPNSLRGSRGGSRPRRGDEARSSRSGGSRR